MNKTYEVVFMELSVLITSLPFSPEESFRALAEAGFRHVDLIGKVVRSEAEREALAESGLIVDCVALGRDLPAGSALDAADVAQRRAAVAAVEQQINEAAQVGARCAYVVPCKAPDALPAFADSCRVLSALAKRRRMQLCIEHFPGSALPTASGTLDWLRSQNDLKLLLDLGHCLISKEDPCQVVAKAGAMLGYVQLDDNDGSGDLHWPLLSGVLSAALLKDFLRCLQDARYEAGIALELNGKLDEPLQNLLRSQAACGFSA
jgi:sugar phosphate isomerase/epimerase